MEQALEQTRLVQVTPPGYQTAWQVVIGQLRHDMRRGDYDSWVAPLQPLSFKEGVFRVGAHNSFCRDWVESRLRVQISNLLEMVLGQKVSLRFTLIHEAAAEEQRAAEDLQDGQDLRDGQEPQLAQALYADADKTPITRQAPPPRPVTPSNGNATRADGRNGSGSPTNGSFLPHGTGSAVAAVAPSAMTVDETLPTSPTAPISANETTLTADALDVTAPVVIDTPSSTGAIGNGGIRGKKKAAAEKENTPDSPRKIQLKRAYGTERARVVQPERGMFLTSYFFMQWLPLIGHSAMTTILAARSMCYWNPMTGEVRDQVEIEMSDLAARASVSVRTIKDVLNNPLVKQYFLRYKVRRVMTPNGVRTAGIILKVRMDDPLTPEDQDKHNLPELERWYDANFEDESES